MSRTTTLAAKEVLGPLSANAIGHSPRASIIGALGEDLTSLRPMSIPNTPKASVNQKAAGAKLKCGEYWEVKTRLAIYVAI